MSRAAYDFSGKVALITGAASGIGRATALRFAEHGARVVLGDLDRASGDQVLTAIHAAGAQGVFVSTDVRRAGDCHALVVAALQHYGQLDFAFNNAGIFGAPQRLGDGDDGYWQQTVDVNLHGVLNCLHAELRVMRDVGGGCIVNNASVMGLRGGSGATAYCASKHGVIGATKAAALDYGRSGIRINAVCPGFVSTPMTSVGGGFTDKAVVAAVRRTALGRMGQPEEIAEAVLWLCSDSAAFVTGSALAVDGGFTTA